MAKGKKGSSKIGVALAGAALGAAAAVLSDPKNRKAIGKTVSNVVDEGEKGIELARKYIDKVGAKANRKNAVGSGSGKRKKRSTKPAGKLNN